MFPAEQMMSNEFVITRRVQFVETDLAGVLHFSNYYRYMEEVECAFWRDRGLGVHSPSSSATTVAITA